MSAPSPYAAPRVVPFGGKHPELAEDVFVADTARVIGRVRLGTGANIWYGVVLRGDVHDIAIGARTNIQDLTVIHVTSGRHGTTVGEEVTVGHRAILHGCTVHDRALIGMGAIVLDGAVIGEETMVGAGAVVTPRTIVPPRTLVLGNPARVVRDLTPQEIAFLKMSALHYVSLAKRYRDEEANALNDVAGGLLREA